MPIKQVVCSICKETVNKAVTYHVGGTDRACKKHEGVAEKKDVLQAQKAKKAIEDLQKQEHRLYSMRGESWSQDFKTPKCWVCMNTGMKSQEFFLRYLIECEKQSKITGKPVLPLRGFDGGIKMNTRCIFVLPKEQCASAMKYVREEFQTLIQMAGFVAICGDCCHLNKIQAMPDVKWEDLRKGMVLSELVIRPAIEAQAAHELARDN